MNQNDEREGPSLPKRVSASEQGDALWKRQYEALVRGEVLSEHQNIQCLDYYPLTLVLGRAFEQVGRVWVTKGETGLGQLFRPDWQSVSLLGGALAAVQQVSASALTGRRQGGSRIPTPWRRAVGRQRNASVSLQPRKTPPADK